MGEAYVVDLEMVLARTAIVEAIRERDEARAEVVWLKERYSHDVGVLLEGGEKSASRESDLEAEVERLRGTLQAIANSRPGDGEGWIPSIDLIEMAEQALAYSTSA